MEKVIKRAKVKQGITAQPQPSFTSHPTTRRALRDRIIDWPSTSCLHCRRPIIVGQLWTVVSNGEVTARFHQDCHGEWLEAEEEAARRVLGFAP